MIVVDTSALLAIIFNEPERADFINIIARNGRALISIPSVVEARIVVHSRRGQRGTVLLDDLLRLPLFELVPPSAAEAQAAYSAFVTFGKGSGHAAALNYGDLFSYALAKVRGLPLLFNLNPAVDPKQTKRKAMQYGVFN